MKPTHAAIHWLACALWTIPALASAGVPPPEVDHHQHLLSPRAAEILNNPTRPVEMPAAVTQVLRLHEAAWNAPAELGAIYSENATALRDFDPAWLRGRQQVTKFIGTRFARPYAITRVAYSGEDRRGRLVAYFSRGEGPARRHIGSVLFDLVRENDEGWRISLAYPAFPGPRYQEPLDAERLVALLDAAGMKRAVVLSVGYWFDSPSFPLARSAVSVRAENDWTAEQTARFPDRLVAFCSLNRSPILRWTSCATALRTGASRD